MPLAGGIHAAIVDARRAHLQGTTSGDELADRRLAVPHHLRAASFIASLTVPLDVFIDFRLQRLMEHLQRPALQEIVQRGPQFLVLFRRLLDYSQHGWRLLLPVANRGSVLNPHEGYAAFSSFRRSTTFGYISVTSWGTNGQILFTDLRSPVCSVSASGGHATAVTTLDASRQEVAHHRPQFLPDGRHFLYYVESAVPERSGTYLGSIDQSVQRWLAPDSVLYARNHLLYIRDQTLMAQPFNPSTLRLTAMSTAIVGDLMLHAGGGISASERHLLAFGGNRNLERFVWFDRSGLAVSVIHAPSDLYSPELTADQRSVLATSGQPNSPRGIWMIDLDRGVPSRITDGVRPVSSPDGSHIVFSSDRATGIAALYLRTPVEGGKEELLLRTDQNKMANGWSSDGRYVVYTSTSPETRADLWVLPILGDRVPIPFLQTPSNEWQAQVSPDGRWIAYSSDESGTWEVYTESFPTPGAKQRVSFGGGTFSAIEK